MLPFVTRTLRSGSGLATLLAALAVLVLVTPARAQVDTIDTFPFTEHFESPFVSSTGFTTPFGTLRKGWTRNSNTQFSWKIGRAGTGYSSGTGPDRDAHPSRATGRNYMFTEASAGGGNLATLTSPPIDLRGKAGLKLTYAYHMYGARIDYLILQAENAAGTWVTIDSLSGQDQTRENDPWKDRTVFICPGNRLLRIRFIGRRNGTVSADMAIDNLRFDTMSTGVDLVATGIQVGSGTYCPSSQTVYARVQNKGTNAITTATFNWSVNGTAQTAVNWTGSIPPCGGDTLIALGTYTFGSGTYNLNVTGTVTNDPDTTNNSASVTGLRASLSGIYTIGGTSPDFDSIINAVQALEQYGVCGPVTFHIRQDTYDEQITIKTISGATGTNTITFRPDPANTQPVVWQWNAVSSAANYTVQLEGGSHIRFVDLVMRALNANNMRIFNWDGLSNDIRIDSCQLRAPNSTSTSTWRALIFLNGQQCRDIEITNNTFRGGSYGAYIRGSSLTNTVNNVAFDHNDLDTFYHYAIYAWYVDTLSIHDNRVEHRGGATWSYGFSLGYADHLTMTKNHINIHDDMSYGVYMYRCDGSSSNRSLVANNMFNFLPTSSSDNFYGWYLRDGRHMDFVFNTIRLASGNNQSRALYIIGSGISTNWDSVNVTSNNVVNLSQGYALYYSNFNHGTRATSDHNNLYAPNGNPGYYNGNRATLANWQTAATGLGANSVSVDPIFVSATDLHVNHPGLNATATPTTGVTDDIDNDPRNATTPDIGADEFTPPPLDGGLVNGWYLPNTGRPSNGDTMNGRVVLQNLGVNQLTSYIVHSQLNGTGTIYRDTVNRNLPSVGKDTIPLNHNFVLPSTGFRHTIKVWIVDLNGSGKDTRPANDTFEITICVAMDGIFTVGGTTPDFPNLVAAIDQLQCSGMGGDVTLRLRAGTYNGQVVVPRVFGMNGTNELVIEGDTLLDSTQAVVAAPLASTGANYVFQFQGVEKVTLRNFTIDAQQNPQVGTAIEFQDTNSEVTIERCRILGQDVATTSWNYRLIELDDEFFNGARGVHNRINIRNNYIFGGSYTIFIDGPTSAVGRRLFNIRIENNIFRRIYAYGIYARDVDGLIIDGNDIEDNAPNSWGNYTIYCFDCYDGTEITNNRIVSRAGNSHYAIYLGDFEGGIGLRNLVANNMVSNVRTGNSHTPRLLYFVDGEYTDIVHNNFLVTDGSTNSNCFYVTSTPTNFTDVTVQNNNFINKGGGYAVYWSRDYHNTNWTTVDYNNYYSTSTGRFVYYNSGNRSNLANLRAASTGLATNAISGDPQYTSPTDLHTRGPAANDKATPLTYVSEDFDGETRSTTNPDIGADEFTPPQRDFGVIDVLQPDLLNCTGVKLPVQVAIRNLANQAQDTIPIVVVASGGITDTLRDTLFRTVQPFTNDTLRFSDSLPALTSTATVNLTVYTAFLNDEDSTNDTLANPPQINLFATPAAPTTVGDSVCENESQAKLYVNVQPNQSYFWYTSPTATTDFHRGDTLVMSPTFTPTTYYVQTLASKDYFPGSVDINSPTGQSNISSTGGGWHFDAFRDLTLDSVTISVTSPGGITIVLRRQAGNTIIATQVLNNLTVGQHRIALGFAVPRGNDYRLEISSFRNGARLQYNFSGASYPYTAPGVVSITRPARGTSSWMMDDFDYFYNPRFSANLCPSPRAPVQLRVDTAPRAPLGNDTTFCVGSPFTLDAENAGATYSWNTGATGRTINASAARTYSVTITNSFGCQVSDTMSVSHYQLPTVNLGTDSLAFCDSFEVDAQNAGATYSWNTGATTRRIQAKATSWYSVTVTDANGCQNGDSLYLIRTTPPVVNLAASDSITICDSITLDAGNPSYLHSWNTNDTSPSILVDTTGFYRVNLRNATGTCFGADSVYVTTRYTPQFDIGPRRMVVCDTVTLSVGNQPGANIIWNTGDSLNSVFVDREDTFAVRVTDSTGTCSRGDTVRIVIPDSFGVDLATQDTLSLCDSVVLDAGNPGYRYRWTTGANKRRLVIKTPGTYGVLVTEPNGVCSESDQVVVAVTGELPVDLGPDTLTLCNPVDLDAGHPGGAWFWSTGVRTKTLRVDTAGTYRVTVVNANGICRGTDSIVVRPGTPLNLNLEDTLRFCDSLTLTSGYFNGYTNVWSTGDTTDSLVVRTTGIIGLQTSDRYGSCADSDTVVVQRVGAPTMPFAQDTVEACDVQMLDATTPGFRVAWNTGAATNRLTATQGGLYTVALRLPSGACLRRDSVYLDLTSTPLVDLGPATMSFCNALTLSAGNAPSVTWSTGANTPTLTVTLPDTYAVQVTSANGRCSSTDTIVLTPGVQPTVDLGANGDSITVCGATMLDAGEISGFATLWNTGDTTPQLMVDSTGLYIVNVRDQSGTCAAEDTVHVTVHPTPGLQLPPLVQACDRVTLVAGTDTSLRVQWSTGATDLQLVVAASGQVAVTLTDPATNCSSQDTVTVEIRRTPDATPNVPDSGLVGQPITIQAAAGQAPATYRWFFGQDSLDATPRQDTGLGPHQVTFHRADSQLVTLIGVNGFCTDTSRHWVVVQSVTSTPDAGPSPALRIFPNPNRGQFVVELGNLLQPATLAVYDANGKLIWHGEAQAGPARQQPVDLGHVAAGLYLLRLQQGDRITDAKLMVR